MRVLCCMCGVLRKKVQKGLQKEFVLRPIFTNLFVVVVSMIFTNLKSIYLVVVVVWALSYFF